MLGLSVHESQQNSQYWLLYDCASTSTQYTVCEIGPTEMDVFRVNIHTVS